MWSRRVAWIHRVPAVVVLLVLLAAGRALARVGGGEHYDSGNQGDDSGDAIFAFIFRLLLQLAFEHPVIGIPLLTMAVVGFLWAQHQKGSATTRRAIDRVEAERRTRVSSSHTDRWVAALQARDPAFQLLPFLDRAKGLFLQVQAAWLARNLEPVRRFLSDATWQRLMTQLSIMRANGLRDAMAGLAVFDLRVVGFTQSPQFDTLHVSITAEARDVDVSAQATDAQAQAAAQAARPE